MTRLDVGEARRQGGGTLAAGAAVLLCVPAVLLAALLSIGACIGSGGAGVAAGSPRGQVCDIPAVGPWPYPIVVAVLACAWSIRALVLRGTTGRGMLAMVVLPALAVLLVPLALVLVPR